MRTGAAGAGAGAAAAVAAGEGGAGAGDAADSDSEDSSVLAFAQEAPVLENGGAYEEAGMPDSHDSDDMAAARVLAASFIPAPPSTTPIQHEKRSHSSRIIEQVHILSQHKKSENTQHPTAYSGSRASTQM